MSKGCQYCRRADTQESPPFVVTSHIQGKGWTYIGAVISKELQDYKSAHWKAFDKRATKYEKQIQRELKPFFEKQKDWALGLLTKNTKSIKSIKDLEEADWEDWDEELQSLMKPIYATMIAGTGKAISADIGASFDVLSESILEFTENKLDKIVECNVTTQNAIKEVLVSGIEHGDDIQTMANGIESVFEDAIGYRSTVIARTEVIGTSNWATFEAYRQSGVVSGKEWVSTQDARTREEHDSANGQVVGLDEPFIVGGEQLMYPGDPNGSAENIIQCRCTLIAVLEE